MMQNIFGEIQRAYGKFHDAMILKVVYDCSIDEEECVLVVVHCKNVLNQEAYERIEITFRDVVSFRFVDGPRASGMFVNTALLREDDGIIMFDFSPVHVGSDGVEEDEDSTLKIKCARVSYRKLS